MGELETTLTPKQEAFCQEYLIDLNGTQAAIRAGYSEKTANEQASRLLANVNISRRVQTLRNERMTTTKVTAEYVLSTIVEVIERCKQATPVMEWSHEEKAMVPTGEWKFEHQGVLKGTELLGRHLKMWTDKVELDFSDNLAERMANARKQVVK